MIKKSIAVVDYGMGNVWSVISAFKYLGVDAQLISDPKDLHNYKHIILPGVGSFGRGMLALRNSGLGDAILNVVENKDTKLLGICLGMHLLGTHGTEGGDSQGLGLIDNKVEKFTTSELGKNKIPHVGFNSVGFNEPKGLFKNMGKVSDFYFTHSYRMLNTNVQERFGECYYGINFLAAFEQGNICGTQFHPEKSQTNGLILLKNFLDL